MKYFKMAKKLNEAHHDELKKRELHFRGNRKSFSLISLSQNTPEVGISSLTSEKQGENALNDRIASKLTEGLGRTTPEKALQAWIIKHALNNEMLLPFGNNLRFLTSELAFIDVEIKSKDKHGKLVNDLLAIDACGDLWVIELKSDRQKKILTDQVNDYIALVNHECDFFSKLVRMLLSIEWSGKVCGMVVWPFAKTSPLDWDEIAEVCYQPEFTFKEF